MRYIRRPVLAWYVSSHFIVKELQANNLAELGGVFFSIREKNFDALARAKANRDFSKRTELEAEMARQREE